MTPAPLVASLELGGTKCIAAISRGPEVLRIAQQASGDRPAAALGVLLDELADWQADLPFEAIGIATFGPVMLDPASPDFGRILLTPKAGWSGFDVRGYVAARFDLPIAIDTDVAGAALAEGRWGAARRARTHAYVTIGTGIGVGLVLDGCVHHGMLHPEAGHIAVRRAAGDEFAGICPFHGDCLEGLASGPAIAARTGRAGPEITDDDPVWPRVAGEVAELMATLVLMLAPERIIIGGGVVASRQSFLDRVRAATSSRLGGYLHGLDAPALARLIVSPGLALAGPLGGSALAAAMLCRDKNTSGSLQS